MTRFMTTEEDVPLSKQSPVLVETYFFYDRWFTWVIAWDVSNGTPCTLQLQQCDSLVIYTRINYLCVTCHWWLDLKSKLKTNVPFLFRHGMYNETKLGNTKFCHVKNQSSARSWGDKQTNDQIFWERILHHAEKCSESGHCSTPKKMFSARKAIGDENENY